MGALDAIKHTRMHGEYNSDLAFLLTSYILIASTPGQAASTLIERGSENFIFLSVCAPGWAGMVGLRSLLMNQKKIV